MKACPSQVVLAHSQPARIIANVFVVGYSIFKVQMMGKDNLPPHLYIKRTFFDFQQKNFKKFSNIFYPHYFSEFFNDFLKPITYSSLRDSCNI